MARASEGWKFLLIFVAFFCNDVVSQDEQGSAILPDCIFGAKNVDYYLYNRDIPDGIIVDLESNETEVKADVTTIFLVHGFISEANTSQYQKLTNILVDKYDVNVFSVDWKEGACTQGGMTLTQLIGYPAAVGNTRTVGQDMSKFIAKLIRDYGIKLEDIMLIGHSLGAQVVGFAGKDVQNRETGTINQIIALDPAGPGFESNSCSNRICSTDAEFVQVFHTSYALGMHREVGNIDFYFNGGRNQPSCSILERIPCSHSSAIRYLIDIYQDPDCKYIGRKWKRSQFFAPRIDCSEDTCSVPGPLASELPARGTFYVDTEDLPSFCLDR